jgi:hypothetical protein
MDAVLALSVTMIPDPDSIVNVVEPMVERITPPDYKPVYRLDSNHRKRVVFAYPAPF